MVLYQGKPISVQLPNTVVREIPDRSGSPRRHVGKVTKPAHTATGFVLSVPLFCDSGDKVEIDTRTGEYKRRV